MLRQLSVLALTAALGAAAACGPAGPPCQPVRQQAVLEPEGDAIVARVEAFRRERGRLPTTLAEAGVNPASRIVSCGEWRYARHAGGIGYSLAIGEYMDDGSVLFLGPKRTSWSVDA